MITIGFSPHRAEVLPFAIRVMEKSQVVVLEDPPYPHFTQMLDGRITIDTYLMEVDTEFPEFERLMCKELQRLRAKGAIILQVEPYLEGLLQIHEHFAEGKTPEEIQRLNHLAQIYRVEKKATGRLINYYRCSLENDFDRLISSVAAFARADAERSRLRSMMRAKAIVNLDTSGEIYVESGYIHYPIYRFLIRECKGSPQVRVVFLLQPVFRRLGCKRRNMGPGDILTLHYALDSKIRANLENLLAARSLVYIKLIQKEEMLPGPSDAPHTEDEAAANRLVDRLGFEDCERLYPEIRFKKQDEAWNLVNDYLGEKKYRN